MDDFNDDANPSDWMTDVKSLDDIPLTPRRSASKAITFIFIDANTYEGAVKSEQKTGVRITEIGFLIVSTKRPDHITTTNHPILKTYLGSEYFLIQHSVSIIKPRDFESKNDMAQFGAEIKDVLAEITNSVRIYDCNHCFFPKKEIYTAIKEEAKLLDINICLFEHINKTFLNESMQNLYKSIGKQSVTEYGHPANVLYRGVFEKRAAVGDPPEIGEYLQRMAASFLELIGKKRIICR